jgi:hypothetical protein
MLLFKPHAKAGHLGQRPGFCVGSVTREPQPYPGRKKKLAFFGAMR